MEPERPPTIERDQSPAPAQAAERSPDESAGIHRLSFALRWETALAVALVVVVVLGTQVSSQFLSSYNIFTLCTNIGDLAIMALPMTLIIITGEIDLSVASILALSAELLGYLWLHHWPMALIFVVVLAVGAVAGAINGVLITRVGLPSLAVTIGTLTLYRGLANVILGPATVSNFPTPFSNLGVSGFLGIQWLSWSVAMFAVLAVAFGVTLRMTPLGRSLYAIGNNAGQQEPAGPGALIRSILVSLACKYRLVLEQLQRVTSRRVEVVHVVGGGVRNALLCQLTADVLGLPVLAGPEEATALGNVLVQARACGELSSLEQMRELVTRSVSVDRYDPTGDANDETYSRFLSVTGLGAGRPATVAA